MRVLYRATPTVTRASVLNGHLRGPVTLTPIAERLAVELSLPAFEDFGLSRLGFEYQPSACWANTLTHDALLQI